MKPTRTDTYADLGDAWVHHQIARLHQRHLQYGWHWRLDADAVLDRAARSARAGRPSQAANKRETAATDHIWRAALEAIVHCA